MFAPLSWLKDYVEITLSTKELAWRLTELGLGVETVKKVDGEEVLELEITPNRPDLLSIVGIAREIAAIENRKINLPSNGIPVATKKLPLKVNNNFSLFHRYSAVIIDNIKIKPSPAWLQQRLILLGLRPINNIVDITNYVMFELGIPLHAFDYDEIKGHEINVTQAAGGESFVTVDELSYHLPKGAIIICDKERIIDLCGIKGGLNSGIKDSTKTVLIQTTADDPLLIRRTSQALSLRSDASVIFERGVDKGGTQNTLLRATQLTLELAGGSIASDIIDLKEKEFLPCQRTLRLSRLTKVLGITIPRKNVLSILENLSLQPKQIGEEIIVTVPTYRGDLQIEEDLIEEVARVYGYNEFPKTLPRGEIPTQEIAYYKDYAFEEKVKQLLASCGFSEINTYSLISKVQLGNLKYSPDCAIKVTNPVSLDYEYLRPTLLGNILQAIKQNEPYFASINLFELGKTYHRESAKFTEPINLIVTRSDGDYRQLKGTIEVLLESIGIKDIDFQPQDKSQSAKILIGSKQAGSIGVLDQTINLNFGLKIAPAIAELDMPALLQHKQPIKFVPISPYPNFIEDLSFVVPDKTYVGMLMREVKQVDKLIKEVILLDSFDNTRTFRIIYHDKDRTLSAKDVKCVREKILSHLATKFHLSLKQ